jgi:hypothetical protein
MNQVSRGEKLSALIAVGFNISLDSFPVWQSTIWRPWDGSAITATRPFEGANFPKVAVGYDGKPDSTTIFG